ncbi:meiosis inhibitor protein 1 isoform X13 [Coturnix japonica]|uniref:meiosis inhibitor protein 1 isoform X13 n=1 Tax=Coturnix japonica TaxID=93934 RepID=UPI0007771963|nr:meiosis inhibitor protein 1 isoform X13 [Coturnix japonica]
MARPSGREAMAAGCESVRDRHGARWNLPLRPPLCLACAVETLGDGGASLVRKKHALSRLRDALAWQALPVVQLLAPDERGCLCLIGTLFGLCHAVEDSDTQDQFGEVLVQLIVELKSEQYLRCILDESQKELCKATTRRGSLPTFTLLGKLADAVPVFADILVVEHSNLVDHLLVGLVYPNEGVKAAVCYLYGKLYSSPVGTEKLSAHFEERLCGLFLNTFGHAQTKELQINCLGLLKELLKSDRFVAILMNNSKPEEESENSDLLEGENPLPLILKKLLLTRDEMLQAASSHCMAAVLVHSPSRYAPAFIHADVPEFLFECLMCNSEILIWSVYCSLLLLAEERLFFSKCHTVYGIESLVRSLQDVLQLNNVELHKQGLLLFTEIVKRQPVEIKLFTNRGVCVNAIDVLMKAVDCPVLEVVVEAVKAVAAFLRKDHLSSPPVPYEKLQKLLEAVLKRCVDLSPPHSSNKHEGDLLLSMSQSRVSWKHGQLLLNTLESFRNACRLAVELQSDPMAQENAFTAPCSESKETLNNFSEFLLRICDSLCIPMVMNYLERAVNPSVMEVFISALNTLFTVVPNMRDKFSKKLASSFFIRLTLELKARFCSVQSNPALNQACSSFLCKLCLSLYSATEKERTSSHEEQEMSELLQKSLPQLNYTVAESLLLLAEDPEPLSLDQSLCNHQHCFILLLYFAYTLGDRFVPEAELFLAIRNFLLLAQDHRDCSPPYVLRAVLYLLAVCQDKGKALDSQRLLCTIKRILDNLPDLSLVYIHCPLLLKFFLHYPELMGRFGHQVLQLWFSWEDCNRMETEETAFGTSDQLNSASPLLPILKSNSSILLILLDLVCSSSVEVAQKVLMALRTFLEINDDVFVCDLLRNQFLQILQQLLVESSSASLQVSFIANRNLPILLSLLFLVQLRSKGMRELDSTDFKLLHQGSPDTLVRPKTSPECSHLQEQEASPAASEHRAVPESHHATELLLPTGDCSTKHSPRCYATTAIITGGCCLAPPHHAAGLLPCRQPAEPFGACLLAERLAAFSSCGCLPGNVTGIPVCEEPGCCTTCCFAALAPIPAPDVAQWEPEVHSAARNSQAHDFVSEISEQQYHFSKRNWPDSPGSGRSQFIRATRGHISGSSPLPLPDSEQPLSRGASAGTDYSDLAGAPSTTDEHLCKTSGHCMCGQCGDSPVTVKTETRR